jgi:hypothetical protein
MVKSPKALQSKLFRSNPDFIATNKILRWREIYVTLRKITPYENSRQNLRRVHTAFLKMSLGDFSVKSRSVNFKKVNLINLAML